MALRLGSTEDPPCHRCPTRWTDGFVKGLILGLAPTLLFFVLVAIYLAEGGH